MPIESRAINWGTAFCASALLLFALAATVLSFYLNLTTLSLQSQEASIAALASLGVLAYPTIWIAYMAAISRHKGVYITLVTLGSLSTLDSVGMLIQQAYVFSTFYGFRAIGLERGITIGLFIMQCMVAFMHLMLLGFAISALCVRPKQRKDRAKPSYYQPGYYQPGYYNPPPTPRKELMPSSYRYEGYPYYTHTAPKYY